MANPITNRVVSGPFGEVGYIVRKPSHAPITHNLLEDNLQKDEDARRIQRELDKMNRSVFIDEFWMSADLRSLNSRVNRLVKLGMEAHELDLDQKRNKLKVMMLREQSKLTMEYTDKAQKSAEHVFERKKKKAEEIQKTARDAEKSFVEKEYGRLFKQNCDELRTRIERENRMALNEIHKAQMCEKLMAEEMEKEEEKIWAALEEKENEKLLMRSNQDRAFHDQYARDYVSGLNEQMRDADYRKLNEACVERLEESWRTEIQDMKEREYEQRDTVAKQLEQETARDLVRQLEANRLIRDRQRQEEKYLDMLMINADLEAYRAEQAAVTDNRCQLRSELAIFRESLKQQNDAREAYEKQMEQTCAMQKNAIEDKQRNARRKNALAKQELLQKCMEDRKKQIDARKAAEEQLKKTNQENAELLKFRLAQNEALDGIPKHPGQILGKPKQYFYTKASQMNGEQSKYTQLLRRREESEAQEIVSNIKKYEGETERKIEELLKSPLQSLGGTGVHPFLPPLLAGKK